MKSVLCVIARIDERARQRLLLLEKIAESHGIPLRHLHGHITLAVYTGTDESAFISSCKAICAGFAPFSVRYDQLKILREPSTIVACPPKNGVLAELQQRIVDEWAEELHIWSQPGIWLPHTTLVQDVQADLDSALLAMQNAFEAFDAHISTVEFSAVRPDGYEIVEAVELKIQDKA